MSSSSICGIAIPDSRIAREARELVRDNESDLLFHHSSRVYFWAALTGKHKGLGYDPELLYVAAMFHDLGLTARFHESQLRFEVDSANAARGFLRGHGIAEEAIAKVWVAIALHSTPGIPEFMHAEAALLQVGAGMDVVGRTYDQFTDKERDAVTAAFPREQNFKRDIIEAFYDGLKHRPDSTFGTFNDDFLACKDPRFQRRDLCSVIIHSPWAT
jgi:HD superfamily phosphodiesterase